MHVTNWNEWMKKHHIKLKPTKEKEPERKVKTEQT